MTESSNFVPHDDIHSAVIAVVRSLRCLSVTLVYRVETYKLTIKHFIAWWPHHSNFSNYEISVTVKFRWDHPQQGRQTEVVYQKFASTSSIFIVSLKRCEIGPMP